MTVPQDLRYSKEHEWVRLEGDTATIGITHFAQEQLGDVVFVELPEKGATIRQFSSSTRRSRSSRSPASTPGRLIPSSSTPSPTTRAGC